MTTNTVATVNGGQTVSPPAEEIPSSSGVASPAADRASGVGTSTGSRETGLVVKERASNVAFLHSKINPDEPATAFTEDDINVSADLRVINDVQAVRADPGPSAHEGVSSAMPEVALIIRPTSLLDAVAPGVATTGPLKLEIPCLPMQMKTSSTMSRRRLRSASRIPYPDSTPSWT